MRPRFFSGKGTVCFALFREPFLWYSVQRKRFAVFCDPKKAGGYGGESFEFPHFTGHHQHCHRWDAVNGPIIAAAGKFIKTQIFRRNYAT